MMSNPASPQHHPLITRFAPSPTGYLHLGHVASAIYVWGIAKALGAKILLRIEDHDHTRCKSEYEAAIFDDLAWLGLRFDNAPETWRDSPSLFRQSDCLDIYAAELAKLAASDLVFACACSRKSLQLALASPPAALLEGEERCYPGTCRAKKLPLDQAGTGLRLRLSPPQHADTIRFDDLCLGSQVQKPIDQCGDFLLRDRHGCYTYQFAVTVDDMLQGVNLIVRGQDLTASTGRQVLLARHLGRIDAPFFYHHPLITDPSGRKLGKRFFSEAIAKRRMRGAKPQDVLGEAAACIGLLQAIRPLSIEDVPELDAFTKLKIPTLK